MYQSSGEIADRKIYLVNQSTWLRWLNIIQAEATRGCKQNVWQCIDPNKSSQSAIPEFPIQIQTRDVKYTAEAILDLDSEQFFKFQYLEKRYNAKINKINEIIRAFQEIESYIMGTIQFNNELWNRDVESTWALLRALKKDFHLQSNQERWRLLECITHIKLLINSNQLTNSSTSGKGFMASLCH